MKLIPILCLWIAFMLPASADLPVGVQNNNQGLPTLAPMLERTMPSVVNIATQGSAPTRQLPPGFPFGGRMMPQQPRQGVGSGVIVDARQGYIITNAHVVGNADEITVTLDNGTQLEAELVGSDSASDIAVIKVDSRSGLTQMQWGNSDSMRVGDFVVAIGSPFGLNHSVTSGIVSALGRSGLGIEEYEDFIQTDASINPGNSGGALVNLRGELIGINTAIVGPAGGNVGIGFAIPSSMARSLMSQLIDNGEVRRGMLGVVIQDLTEDLAEALNLGKRRQGAVIAQIKPGSPADRAGLQPGDTVISVNDRDISGASDMRNTIGLLPADSRLKLVFIREGRERIMNVQISEPEDEQVAGQRLHKQLAGATLMASGNMMQSVSADGIVVSEVEYGSAAQEAGLRPGDIITAINQKPVETIRDARKLLKSKRKVLLTVQRGSVATFVPLG